MAYGKIFEQLYDSTIIEDPPDGSVSGYQVTAVFVAMVVLSDSEGRIDMTAEVLARRINMPPEIVRASIAVLEAPDRASRSKAREGRRLIRIDDDREWGWVVTNKHRYRSRNDNYRAKERERKRRQRERDRCTCGIEVATPEHSHKTECPAIGHEAYHLGSSETTAAAGVTGQSRDNPGQSRDVPGMSPHADAAPYAEKSRKKPSNPPAKSPRKGLSEHQARVRAVLDYFESFEVAPPRHSLAAKWIKHLGEETLFRLLKNLGAVGLRKGDAYITAAVNREAKKTAARAKCDEEPTAFASERDEQVRQLEREAEQEAASHSGRSA